MKPWNKSWLIAAAMLLIASPAMAQLDELIDRDSFNVSNGDWTNDDNWVDDQGNPSGQPGLDFGRWAIISNGGTAIVDAEVDTGALQVSNGTVDIRQGGSLTVDVVEDFTSGSTTLGKSGAIHVSGDGQFSGQGFVSEGTVALSGPGAKFALTGDFDQSGTLNLSITGDGSPSISVGGKAILDGTLAANFDGVSPQLGDSFQFMTGADQITDNGLQLVLPDTVVLGRGLSAAVTSSGGNAALEFRNVPVLSVNRVTGAAKIMNVVGDALELTGYSIFSDNELLSVDGWNSLAAQAVSGWNEASPRADVVAELGFDSTSLANDGSAVEIGNPYQAGAIAPRDEDLQFEASLADGSVVAGIVEYEGPPNNLTLTVDPATGSAEISHRSSFIDPIDVTGYSIVSESGALNVEGWSSFVDSNTGGEGWLETTPNENQGLAEINPTGSLLFNNGTAVEIGSIFTSGGLQDLVFEFATADSVFEGSVVYGEIGGGGVVVPPPALAGDVDGDGDVDFDDFVALSNSFNQAVDPPGSGADFNSNGTVDFDDFVALSNNFGRSAAASVPEPTGLAMLSLGGLLFLLRRRHR